MTKQRRGINSRVQGVKGSGAEGSGSAKAIAL